MASTQNIEVVTFVTPETYIYSIPPLKSNRGHRASEWDAENPLWKGRLTMLEVENPDTKELHCELVLDDSETGELFAKAPYSSEGRGVEPVADSSRFFAIRVVDGDKHAVLGLGFPDRNVAFEFNIALQNFRKHTSIKDEDENKKPKKDFSLKEGEKIHLNLSSVSESQKKESEPSDTNISIPNLPPPPSASGHSKSNSRSDPFDDDFGDFVG